VFHPASVSVYFNQNYGYLRTKIKKIENFFTPFLPYSYENREPRIKYLFRIIRASLRLLREGGIISKRYEEKQKFIWSA
jgi:hypothetical protein